MDYFKNLSESEVAALVNAIPAITILIAGADGNIDEEETAWAAKIVKFRSHDFPEKLAPYYKLVGTDYTEALDFILAKTPIQHEARNKVLFEELEKTNEILAKVDRLYAIDLLESWRSFAKHVAEASGGILGYFSIGPKEHKLIDLPMIEDIK